MKKVCVTLIAMVAILCMSCGSKTQKAEKEITYTCVCDSCKCDPCECAEQGDTTAVSQEEGVVESVNETLNKTQTKAKAGRDSCRHAGCGCQSYVMAHDGSGGKCICGHWDYVHN